MRAALVVTVVGCVACGDNTPGEVPLAPARTLFIAAHMDDDLIFMQPALRRAVERGDSMTVYMTSRDPHGRDATRLRFASIRTAYGKVSFDEDWQCGRLFVNDLRTRHCRAYEHQISLLALNVPDGGRHAQLGIGLTQLVQGDIPDVVIVGDRSATRDELIGELAEVLTAVQPEEIHILDYAANHGDDHPDHTMVASFALWAMAAAGYHGRIVSHRGYSVEGEDANLPEADYRRGHEMVGYYEACNDGCAPCGQACETIDLSHDLWLQRQYAMELTFPSGRLVSLDLPGQCLAVVGGALRLAACASADAVRLDEQGQLIANGLCVASAAGNDDPLQLVACDRAPATAWFLDSEGGLWNGQPVLPTGEDMQFDHTRCLIARPLGAPVCGSRKVGRWQVVE